MDAARLTLGTRPWHDVVLEMQTQKQTEKQGEKGAATQPHRTGWRA